MILLTGTPIPNGVTEFYSLLLLLSYTLKPTNGLKIDKDFPTPESFYRNFAFEVNYKVRVKGGSRSITRYEGLKNKEELKKHLKDKYIILMIGRLSREKRQDLIIKAVKTGKKKQRPVMLYFPLAWRMLRLDMKDRVVW